MAPRFWQHTHFGTFPAGTFLFLLHELRAACSEEQEQWAAVPSPPLRGSWFCTAHTLQYAKHEEGQPLFPGAKSFSLALWGGRQWVKGNKLEELIHRWHLTVVTTHLYFLCIHFLLSIWKFCTGTTNHLGNLSIWLNSTCDKERSQREDSVMFLWY